MSMSTDTTVIASPSRSPHPLIWVAGISLIVFCGLGIGAMAGWIPTSFGQPADPAIAGKLDQPKAMPAKPAVARAAAAKPAEVKPAAAPAPVAVASTACADCGIVQSVVEVNAKGEGSGLGAVGGAVAGGVVGSQIGGGDGRTVMAVVGAVGGAIAGNEIEKRVKSTRSYEITVRFNDGSVRMISEANATSWRAGDKVKVVNGVLQSNA